MARILQKIVQLPAEVIRNYGKSVCMRRTFTTGKFCSDNYEGDGKTTVTILNREYKHLVMIDSVSTYGFRLNNGIFVLGPVATFPRTVLQWNVNSIREMTPDALALFCLLEPKLDILVIGTGDKTEQLNKEVSDYLQSKRISTEILPTEQACSTFNFLNVEGRCVAGAFLPPENVTLYVDEIKLLGTHEPLDEFHKVHLPRIET